MKIKVSLEKSGLDLFEAEIILSSILKKDRSFLLAFPETELTDSQLRVFNQLIERRKNHEPVSYILGYKDFFGLRFFVNRDVLIPRHDTEVLVEKALAEVKNLDKPTIVDVGTGSGCISISLAKSVGKPTKIIATDISKQALEVARKNAKLHSVLNKIDFIETDLIEGINEELDLIVANLPYAPKKKYLGLEKEIVDFEPRIAIESGNSSMTFYNHLFKQARGKLKSSGKILYEIDGDIFEKTI